MVSYFQARSKKDMTVKKKSGIQYYISGCAYQTPLCTKEILPEVLVHPKRDMKTAASHFPFFSSELD